MASQKRPPKVTAKLDTSHGHHWQEHVKKRLDEFAELVAHFMFERGIDADHGEVGGDGFLDDALPIGVVVRAREVDRRGHVNIC